MSKRNCEYCEAIPAGELKHEYLMHMLYHIQHCSGYGYCPHNLTEEGDEVEDKFPNHKDTRCNSTGCYCDYYNGMDLGNGKGSIHTRYDRTQDTTKPQYRRDY